VHSFKKTHNSDLHNPDAEVFLGGFDRYPIPAAAEVLGLQRRVRRMLSRVQAPSLVIYALGDHSIHPQSGPETVRLLSQYVAVENLVLEDSGHAVVVDKEWEKVAETIADFVQRH
jgi:esterase/lipase